MKGDYGIDAPTVVRNLAIVGVVCGIVGTLGRILPALSPARGLLWPGVSMSLAALWMVFGSKVLKLGVRDRLVSSMKLTGSERVLDVGCGRGLLLIAFAKATREKATGLDLWRTVDQSGNDPARTLENARLEGISEPETRIELCTGDMCTMPFDDASFDVIVSSWAIHNVQQAADRARVVREAFRVLRPGGKLAIVDLRGYATELEQAGFVQVKTSFETLAFFTPSWKCTAEKPTT